MWAFWTGRFIHGNDYWQPLSSWLFVAEWNLFHDDNRKWTLLNLLLHPLCVLLLVPAGYVFASGTRAKRLTTGVVAALLFGGPWLADRTVQGWIVSWWPVQPEIFSLMAGISLLMATVAYDRIEDRRFIPAILGLFFLGLCFKETTYTAGVGACLLLLRKPKRWPLLALIACFGISMFAYRYWALQGVLSSGTGSSTKHLVSAARGARFGVGYLFSASWVLLLLLPTMTAAMRKLRPQWGWAEALVVSLALITLIGSAIFGPFWEGAIAEAFRAGTLIVAGALGLWGLLLALRRWPWPELTVVWLLNLALGWCFVRVHGWHHYWDTGLGSLVWAAGLVELAVWPWRVKRKA